MIYSTELRLTISGAGDLRPVTGYHVYALFLHLIEMSDPHVAARLHDGDGPKPFTISPPVWRPPHSNSLPPGESGSARFVELREGAVARLRLTCLQEEVFAALADAVWRLPAGHSLPLGGAGVTCEGLATTPAQSPWASFTSFAELLEGAGEERRLTLAFLSPTTFRTKGERNTLFPEPSRVFGSLLARWNASAPPESALQFAAPGLAGVRLSAYRLSTRMLDFGSYQEQGFCGHASYELAEGMTPDDLRAVQALGAFAFYSGIGAKTTMGMGQARRR